MLHCALTFCPVHVTQQCPHGSVVLITGLSLFAINSITHPERTNGGNPAASVFHQRGQWKNHFKCYHWHACVCLCCSLHFSFSFHCMPPIACLHAASSAPPPASPTLRPDNLSLTAFRVRTALGSALGLANTCSEPCPAVVHCPHPLTGHYRDCLICRLVSMAKHLSCQCGNCFPKTVKSVQAHHL